jgi:hypothetical protein
MTSIQQYNSNIFLVWWWWCGQIFESFPKMITLTFIDYFELHENQNQNQNQKYII